jgi:hypothetical protein
MTFVYKYLFVPVWAGGGIFSIYYTLQMNEPFAQQWSSGMALMMGWAMVWLIPLMIRLQPVEANNEHLVIRSLREKKKIDYKDIEWVSQWALINPMIISVKYFDKSSGVSKKVWFMPSVWHASLRFFNIGEVEMTQFIRARIHAGKNDYTTSNEPSRWLPVALIIVTGIPVFLLAQHFFMPSF